MAIAFFGVGVVILGDEFTAVIPFTDIAPVVSSILINRRFAHDITQFEYLQFEPVIFEPAQQLNL
jgi:hypothetical protein